MYVFPLNRPEGLDGLLIVARWTCKTLRLTFRSATVSLASCIEKVCIKGDAVGGRSTKSEPVNEPFKLRAYKRFDSTLKSPEPESIHPLCEASPAA